MAAAVWTKAQPTGVKGYTSGNTRVRYWTISSDTGDYTSGTPSYTASELGLSRIINHVEVDGVATQNTQATAQMIGVVYNATNTAVTFYVYESGADGAPPVKKTAEAMVTGCSFRIRVEGQ